MSSTNFLATFFPFVNIFKLSKKEWQLLEVILFISLYQELNLSFSRDEQNIMEDFMISGFLIKGLVTDLLVNQDYSVEGLANYTGYPIDVIYDLAAGMNLNPTLNLSTKIIELHAMARKEFYHELIQKIVGRRTEHKDD